MSKRAYTKRDNSYWESLSKSKEETFASTFEPEILGAPLSAGYEVVTASTRENDASTRTSGRINRSTISPKVDRFATIRQMSMPYRYRNGCVDIQDAIDLTQKAYANISAYKNAVDLMSEFSNTDVYLKGGNKASRDFFNRWFKRINLWGLRKQFFLEYFRSSNIFLYRVDGKFTLEDFSKISTVYAAESRLSGDVIPLKYIVLNPYDMVSNNTSVFYDGMYEKVLSSTELARLKNPITQEDKDIFRALPKEAKDLVKKGAWTTEGIRIKLDAEKIHVSFSKKQDYEPFAIPFGFPVLEDLNTKIEWKRYDSALMRTVESAVLHVKAGEKKDQHGGGVNPKTLEHLRSIFMNGTTGRTLVTDYTVELDFVIPDLMKILGPEKYTILNQDIREGLQNIIVGEEKYGNTQAKINVFLDKLREARNSFLNDFLQPEIKRVAKSLGFKNYPQAFFSDITLQDNTELMRVATRLAELGVLTPAELMDVFKNGEFPNSEEIGENQEAYVSERKKNKWMPLSPVPIVSPPVDPNKANPGSAKKTPIPTASGRPSGSKASIQTSKIEELTLAAKELNDFILARFKEVSGDSSSQETKDLTREIRDKIVSSSRPEEWQTVAQECFERPEKIGELQTNEQILSLATAANLNYQQAALIVWSS